MAKPGQSSFRRILILKILLVIVPILLIGEPLAFRQARSSQLKTAQRNLTTSAVSKGESISNAIAALKANLLVASQTTVLQKGTAKDAQRFLDQLALQLPKYVQCIQLTNLQTGNLVTSTCKKVASVAATVKPRTNSAITNERWPQQQQLLADRDRIRVKVYPLVDHFKSASLTSPQSQLQLLLSTPIYNSAGQLRYALSIQADVHQQERDQAWWQSGSTVVIAENGTILAHPLFKRVGLNIQQADAEIQSIVKAIARKQDFLHVFTDKNGVELLAGYTAIPSPITNELDQQWIILAVTRVDNVLFGLQEIKIILFVLTLGLLGASLLATLYLARYLVRPLEKLRDYALNLQSYHAAERVPHNFKVREFDQLADALDHMVERLKASAEEVETAWEEAQAANQLKSEFLATTSHELRTPLNAIIGCVRLIRDGCCDDREEEMEFLERADEAALHLLGIINDLLEIAKIEAGKLSVVLEQIDLRQVLKEVINLQTVHIQQKGLQLVADVYQEAILVQADPAKLKQVLLNVIGNAVKFTDEGSITISTRIETVADNIDSGGTLRVVITVQDTGVGIDPAQQHKLFRPFVMVDGTTTRKFSGTGLGLAISRNLIELMGGSIMLCSAGSGQGTTVAIAMPMLNVSPLRTPSASAQPSRNLIDLGVSVLEGVAAPVGVGEKKAGAGGQVGR